MSVLAGPQSVRSLIESSGYATLKAFAAAAGLQDYEVSRILSERSPRRPTGSQLRKMAATLGRKTEELAHLLLPPGGLEHEVLEDVVAERDGLISELARSRNELAETSAKLSAAESQIVDMGRTASGLYHRIEELGDDLAREQANSAMQSNRRLKLQQERTALEEQNRSLQRLLNENQLLLEKMKHSAALELAALYRELQHIRDERGREQSRSLQRQILAGTLGAAVGAIITGASAGYGARHHEE